MGTNALRFKGTVAARSEAAGLLTAPGDAVMVERGRPRLLLLACPCGCGEEFPINLDSRSGPAWRLYQERRFGLTLYPSVWRESGCRSHYIVWRNKIYLFGLYENGMEADARGDEISQLAEAVRKHLPLNELVAYADIADGMDAVPWDVLMACRSLVRAKFAREGTGKQRGMFGKA